MKLSDLQSKDIVNINDGKKVGKIIDAEINIEGTIIYLVIEDKRGISFFTNKDIEINLTFDKIKKIGTDVILVDL